MKYERIAGASGVALSLLLMTGCGGPEDVHDSRAKLPAAVEKQVGGHVLQLVYEKPNGKIGLATAVRISLGKKTIDITAAHAAAEAAQNCADQKLIRKAAGKTEYFAPYKQSSVEDYKTAIAQSTADRPELEGHDVAAIVRDDDEDRFGGIKPQKSLDIRSGAAMTFVNYQEAPSGTSRDVERSDKYGQPAQFSGRYIGVEGTKMVALTGEGASYGSIDDNVTRKGSSGGAAFVNDAKTSFAGITVATSNYTVSEQDVQDRFGVSMHVPDGSHLTYIEPVTTGLAQELYQEALAQPECVNAGQ
jgi:hypothetical protein